MKRNYMRLRLLILAITFLVGFTAVVEAKQTVVVGMDRSYAPYAYLDRNNVPAGYEADLIKQVAKRSGWIVEYRIDTWSKICNDFYDGKIDILTGYIHTDLRAEKFVFSNPHTYIQYSAFQRSGSTPVKEWSDLNGKELLVETDDVIQEILTVKKLKTDIIYVNDYATGLNLLSKGKGNISILPKVLGNDYIKAKQLNNILCTSTLDFAYPLCMATNREKSYLIYTINLTLSKMEEDGSLNELRKKWFVSEYSQKPTRLLSRKSIFLALGIVLCLAIIIGFFLLFYRKFLAKQTDYLQEQIREKEGINRELKIVHSLYIGGPVIFMKWYDLDREMFKFVSENVNSLGYKAEDFVTGQLHYRDIIHPEDIEAILADRKTHLDNKEYSYQQEYRILCPSEQISNSDSPTYHMLRLQNPILEKAQSIKIYWVKDHTVVIPANELEPRSFQGYIFDITEQRIRNTDLQANRMIAESADQSKDIFLASITDDIKHPIQILNETIIKLSKTQPTEEQNESLIKLYASTHRMDYIIKQIHSYIDYTKGQNLPTNTWLDLNNTIEAMIPDLKIRTEVKGIGFSFQYPSSKVNIFLHQNYLQDAIRIVFDNALKFSKAGSIALSIDFTQISAIDGKLTLNICDEGEGIPPNRLEYIFKPFTQVDSSYTRAHGGLGLGLAILHRIAEHTNAKVEIANRDIAGTELTITWILPYRT